MPERIEDLDLTISFFAQDRRKFPVSQADRAFFHHRRYRNPEHLRYIAKHRDRHVGAAYQAVDIGNLELRQDVLRRVFLGPLSPREAGARYRRLAIDPAPLFRVQASTAIYSRHIGRRRWLIRRRIRRSIRSKRSLRVFEKHGELILEQLKRRPDPNQ